MTGSNMGSENKGKRNLKILSGVLLVPLVLLLLIIGIIHLPPVQKQITIRLASYLSTKTEAKVAIELISFSLPGNVAIKNLAVTDPQNDRILSVKEIGVRASVINLIRGKLRIDEIRITGMDGKLVESEDGLNIQYILDAFRPEAEPDSTQSKPVTILFNNIQLEDIRFEFNSTRSGTSVFLNLGMFTVTDGVFATQPTTVSAETVFLRQTSVNMLTTHQPDAIAGIDTINQQQVFIPDFGTGIVLDIRNLDLEINDLSLHRGHIATTQKFDPDHITLNSVNVSLSDIIMRDDLLTVNMNSLTAKLPGFILEHLQGQAKVNHRELIVSDLQVTSGTNELSGDLTFPNDLRSANRTGEVRADIQARVNPRELEYFLSDSMMNQFRDWGTAEFAAEAFYSSGKGEVKYLSLKTDNSEVHAKGNVSNVFDVDSVSWHGFVVNAKIGSNIRQIISPFLPQITIPPQVQIQLTSSGNRHQLVAAAKVSSDWGRVDVSGTIHQAASNLVFEGNVAGEQVDLSKWMAIDALGPMDLTGMAIGRIGDMPNLDVSGLISNVKILEQQIRQIAFQSNVFGDSAKIAVSIMDSCYRSELESKLALAEPLSIVSRIQLDSFMLGKLLGADSTFILSGNTKSRLIIGRQSLEGMLEGKDMVFQKHSFHYKLDTLNIQALLSPEKSEFKYYTDHATANLLANFDIRETPAVIRQQTDLVMSRSVAPGQPAGDKTAAFSMDLQDASILKLFGLAVNEFSSLRLHGEFEEQANKTVLNASAGKFSGYGISMDTLITDLEVFQDNVIASLSASDLYYDSVKLGQVNFRSVTKGDTTVTSLGVAGDTISILDLHTHIVNIDSGALIYPDKLLAFNNEYRMDMAKPIYLRKDQLLMDHVTIARDSMVIMLNGNLNAYDVSFSNLNLALLNFLLSPDTTVINSGLLSGNVSYTQDQQLNLSAKVDSLVLFNASPLTVAARAVSDGNNVPFEFRITNTSNLIDLKGIYFTDAAEVDATLSLDINNPELMAFLVSDVFEELHGSITGSTTITGPLKNPALKGSIHFADVGITTVNPRLNFNLEEDSIVVDQSSLLLNRFTLYDQQRNPLTIDGRVTLTENQSVDYDLEINSDQFALINQPDSTRGIVRGVLVIDSDIKIKADDRNKSIDARLNIKNKTALTFLTPGDDIDLITAEGIVDFVEPAVLMDSVGLEEATTLYDSLIASLPDFNLQAKVTIEDNAGFKLLIDEQSGDYLAVSGGANLELGYDRTGNLRLVGDYTITKGVYRLSFYDLVKKNFELIPGSSVTWSGNPKNGDLNIKAVNTVESNSIGLIGHEISENEKSIYKRTLSYQVGINISGTIERPIISFSLDLPQREKSNFPVLASKLERLHQPEHESELNKQVFGLLVLGGFIPESSTADINSSAIATTALANSVNSLLASQLNRFASQYIKGVSIDVGIQSYSDFSAPGGQTQTAMDFRVSKSMMNDRLSFEIGGDFNISQDQSGANTGTKNYRGDIAIIYDLTGNGDKQLKLFNNETFDIVYQEIRNTGISLIFIRDFDSKQKARRKQK